MAIAKIIPFVAQATAETVQSHALPVCTVLTHELAKSLQAVNTMSRRLRVAGVRVEEVSLHDRTILIKAEDSAQLATHFSTEWLGVSWNTKGLQTLNSVRIGGCRVCWLTAVKEQDQ